MDITLIILGLIIFFLYLTNKKLDGLSSKVELFDERIDSLSDEIQDAVQKIQDHIDYVAEEVTSDDIKVRNLVNMGYDSGDVWEHILDEKDPERINYNNLPEFLTRELENIDVGSEIQLLLLVDDSGPATTHKVQYIHNELTYRSSGKRDPIAYGLARLNSSDEYLKVRILFYRPQAKAVLKGLPIEGWVKILND